MSTTVTISAAELVPFVAALFEAAGVGTEEASVVAESLVESNLRGHDSHGVVRVASYLDQINRGELVADAELTVCTQTPALVAADAGFGFGQVQIVRMLDRLVPQAGEMGIACGTMRNCGHVGRLGEWVERAARRGMAALLAVNDNGVLQCVAPPGGTEPRISTNPIAVGVPTGDEPLVLDISTSAVANGRVKVAHVAGSSCPPGWLQDAEGNPTTDPAVRFTDPRGTLLPMGGEQGYKGFGLGLLFDVLVGGLSGGLCPPAGESDPMTNNVLLLVWDPDRFAGRAHFLQQADELLHYVRATHRKPGVDAIQLPGDRSGALRSERLDTGIPLDDGTWRSLTDLAGRLDVTCPEAGSQ